MKLRKLPYELTVCKVAELSDINQTADFFFVGVDTIGCPHVHHAKAAVATAQKFWVFLEMALLSL